MPASVLVLFINSSFLLEAKIDGTFGSKTLAGVLLAPFERVSHLTRSFETPN